MQLDKKKVLCFIEPICLILGLQEYACGLMMFSTVFTSCGWYQSDPGESSPHVSSFRSILILYYHIHLDLPSCFYPFGFLTRNLYEFVNLPVHTTCPIHLIFLDLIVLILLPMSTNYDLVFVIFSGFLLLPAS
jgi:hypothetical protein